MHDLISNADGVIFCLAVHFAVPIEFGCVEFLCIGGFHAKQRFVGLKLVPGCVSAVCIEINIEVLWNFAFRSPRLKFTLTEIATTRYFSVYRETFFAERSPSCFLAVAWSQNNNIGCQNLHDILTFDEKIGDWFLERQTVGI